MKLFSLATIFKIAQPPHPSLIGFSSQLFPCDSAPYVSPTGISIHSGRYMVFLFTTHEHLIVMEQKHYGCEQVRERPGVDSAPVLLSPALNCFLHCPVRRSSWKFQMEQKHIRCSRWLGESHAVRHRSQSTAASERFYSKHHHCASWRIPLTSANWITTLLRVHNKDQGNLFMKHPVRYNASYPTGKVWLLARRRLQQFICKQP